MLNYLQKLNIDVWLELDIFIYKLVKDIARKKEKDNWGCKYFIKDFYRSLNPHEYWADGKKNVTCFNENKSFKKGTITYPFKCKKLSISVKRLTKFLTIKSIQNLF